MISENNDRDRILYDMLKAYRNAIFSQYDTYYENKELYQLAVHKPLNETDFLEVIGDEHRYAEYGHKFLGFLQLFQSDRKTETRASRYRRLTEQIEIHLHDLIISKLKDAYDDKWWYDGVPLDVRVDAAKRHEESDGAIPKENSIYLIHMMKIIIANWNLFDQQLDPLNQGKRAFMSSFKKLNDLRNRLSHPVRISAEPASDADEVILSDWNERLTSSN